MRTLKIVIVFASEGIFVVKDSTQHDILPNTLFKIENKKEIGGLKHNNLLYM
jgi:hypothetical protein